MFWQIMGFLYPIVGLIIFIIPAIFCKSTEEFDHDVAEAFDDKPIKANSKVAEIEMTKE